MSKVGLVFLVVAMLAMTSISSEVMAGNRFYPMPIPSDLNLNSVQADNFFGGTFSGDGSGLTGLVGIQGIDTNAETACSAGEVLFGDGSCSAPAAGTATVDTTLDTNSAADANWLGNDHLFTGDNNFVNIGISGSVFAPEELFLFFPADSNFQGLSMVQVGNKDSFMIAYDNALDDFAGLQFQFGAAAGDDFLIITNDDGTIQIDSSLDTGLNGTLEIFSDLNVETNTQLQADLNVWGDTNARSVTAQAYFGDGSGLTGITAVGVQVYPNELPWADENIASYIPRQADFDGNILAIIDGFTPWADVNIDPYIPVESDIDGNALALMLPDTTCDTNAAGCSNYYTQTDVNAHFVPYIGADFDVNLGAFDLSAEDLNAIRIGTVDLYATDINAENISTSFLFSGNTYTKTEVDDLLGGADFDLFLFDAASADIAGYKTLQSTPSTGVEQSLTIEVSGTAFAFEQFANDESDINISALSEGLYELHIHASAVTAGKLDATLYWEFYRREPDGTEFLIGTSETSPVLTSDVQEFELHMFNPSELTTDGNRFVVKILADTSGAGGNPDVTIFYEGLTFSRAEIVSSFPIIVVPVFPDTTLDTNNLADSNWQGSPHNFTADNNFTNMGLSGDLFGRNIAITGNAFVSSDLLFDMDGDISWFTGANGAGTKTAEIKYDDGSDTFTIDPDSVGGAGIADFAGAEITTTGNIEAADLVSVTDNDHKIELDAGPDIITIRPGDASNDHFINFRSLSNTDDSPQILPSNANSGVIGSSASSWKEIWLSGDANIGSSVTAINAFFTATNTDTLTARRMGINSVTDSTTLIKIGDLTTDYDDETVIEAEILSDADFPLVMDFEMIGETDQGTLRIITALATTDSDGAAPPVGAGMEIIKAQAGGAGTKGNQTVITQGVWDWDMFKAQAIDADATNRPTGGTFNMNGLHILAMPKNYHSATINWNGILIEDANTGNAIKTGRGQVYLGDDVNVIGDLSIGGNVYGDNTNGDINILSDSYFENNVILGGLRTGNALATGVGAFSLGVQTEAVANNCFAFGQGVRCTNMFSVAFGQGLVSANSTVESGGLASFVLGRGAAIGGGSTLIESSGSGSFVVGGAVAIGAGDVATIIANNTASTVIGFTNEGTIESTSTGSTAMGYAAADGNMISSNFGSLAVGYTDARTESSGQGSVAMGWNVQALADGAVTLGKDLENYVTNSVLVNDLNVAGAANFDGNFLVTGGGAFLDTLFAPAFVDSTPSYDSDSSTALAELLATTSTDGAIDHASLPSFTQIQRPIYEQRLSQSCSMQKTYDNCFSLAELPDNMEDCAETKEVCLDQVERVLIGFEEGRDIGATVTMLVEAIKAQDERMNVMEAELCKLGVTSYC